MIYILYRIVSKFGKKFQLMSTFFRFSHRSSKIIPPLWFVLLRIEKSKERKNYTILIRVEIMRGYCVCLQILFDVLGLGTIFS